MRKLKRGEERMKKTIRKTISLVLMLLLGIVSVRAETLHYNFNVGGYVADATPKETACDFVELPSTYGLRNVDGKLISKQGSNVFVGGKQGYCQKKTNVVDKLVFFEKNNKRTYLKTTRNAYQR